MLNTQRQCRIKSHLTFCTHSEYTPLTRISSTGDQPIHRRTRRSITIAITGTDDRAAGWYSGSMRRDIVLSYVLTAVIFITSALNCLYLLYLVISRPPELNTRRNLIPPVLGLLGVCMKRFIQ